MGQVTGIEWTDRTWNPVRGCSLKSRGCTNCYAMKMAHRFSGPGQPYEGLTRPGVHGPTWTGKVRPVPEALGEPLRWRKPSRVFVNSMSDLFHEGVPFDFIDRVFGIMAWCRKHTFQILTKRPERMARYFRERTLNDVYTNIIRLADREPAHEPSPLDQLRGVFRVIDRWEVEDGYEVRCGPPRSWPLPNVWLGVSCEDQETADRRIPTLLSIPAAIRFVSAEPLLGPIDLDAREALCADWRRRITIGTYLDLVIVGGESGPGARPMHPAWARSLRDQCVRSKTAYFFKQWGEWVPVDDDTLRGAKLIHVDLRGGVTPACSPYEPGCPCDHSPHEEPMVRVGKKAAGRLLDGREWDEMPAVAAPAAPQATLFGEGASDAG